MITFKIKEIIKNKNITLTQMSKDIGISRQALSSISNNSVRMISLDTLDKIHQYLNVPISQLINDETNTSVELFIENNKTRLEDNSVVFSGFINIENNLGTLNKKFDLTWNILDNYNQISEIRMNLKIDHSEEEQKIIDNLSNNIDLCPNSNSNFVHKLLYELTSLIVNKSNLYRPIKNRFDNNPMAEFLKSLYGFTDDEKVNPDKDTKIRKTHLLLFRSNLFNSWNFNYQLINSGYSYFEIHLDNESLMNNIDVDKDSVTYKVRSATFKE